LRATKNPSNTATYTLRSSRENTNCSIIDPWE
jgi:hypothetical protein